MAAIYFPPISPPPLSTSPPGTPPPTPINFPQGLEEPPPPPTKPSSNLRLVIPKERPDSSDEETDGAITMVGNQFFSLNYKKV